MPGRESPQNRRTGMSALHPKWKLIWTIRPQDAPGEGRTFRSRNFFWQSFQYQWVGHAMWTENPRLSLAPGWLPLGENQTNSGSSISFGGLDNGVPSGASGYSKILPS